MVRDEVESAVFRRLKLLKYIREVNLSPEETLALIRRVETNSCRAEDYNVLIKLVRAHTELAADVFAEPPEPEPASPECPAHRRR